MTHMYVLHLDMSKVKLGDREPFYANQKKNVSQYDHLVF